MERFLNHFVQGHILPLLLLPVAASGLCCFAISGLPEAFRSPSTSDRVLLLILSLLGLGGSAATFLVLRNIRRRPPTWRLFELGRTAWLASIGIAWLAGVACGIILLFDTL